MNLPIELEMVLMPNFIRLKVPSNGQKQDGFNPDNNPSIPVKDLTEEQAELYAEEMKQAFINHWIRLTTK